MEIQLLMRKLEAKKIQLFFKINEKIILVIQIV